MTGVTPLTVPSILPKVSTGVMPLETVLSGQNGMCEHSISLKERGVLDEVSSTTDRSGVQRRTCRDNAPRLRRTTR